MEIGAALRSAREERGLSLLQLAHITKISVAMLRAIESNDINKLPGGIFTRSFVKAYAREVGLDPDEGRARWRSVRRIRQASCRALARVDRGGSAFEDGHGQFSPDGRWVAYESNEPDRFEVYVQPFPGPGAKTRVSTIGGGQVRWRRDGRELFYIAADGTMVAAPVRLGADHQTVEIGAPAALFMTRVGGFRQGINRQQYSVDSAGQRFLMNTITEEPASPITVLLNWNPSR